MKLRKLIVVFAIIASAAVMAGVGLAANQAASRSIYRGQGIACDVKGPNAICVLQGDPRGDFGVGISRSLVMVMRYDSDGSSHVVYKHYQP